MDQLFVVHAATVVYNFLIADRRRTEAGGVHARVASQQNLQRIRENIMADDNKCGHEGCACAISGDEEFCSDHCRNAADQDITEISCDCGHSGCGIL